MSSLRVTYSMLLITLFINAIASFFYFRESDPFYPWGTSLSVLAFVVLFTPVAASAIYHKLSDKTGVKNGDN